MRAPLGQKTTDPHECAAGLERYVTSTPGLGGRLKTYPEDFVVEEVPLAFPKPVAEGKYTIASLRVRNWETNRLMAELGKRLHLPRESIFFAGTKDKRALTTQYVSLRASEAAVRALDIKDVEVLETHRVDRAPKIGELVGNRFILRVRDIETDEDTLATLKQTLGELDAMGGFPNYFGLQRFGTMRPVTHRVGEAILANDIPEAIRLYVGNPMDSDPPEARAARRHYDKTRDAATTLDRMPDYLSFERRILYHLVNKPDDHIGALWTLPPNLRTMFVYAKQSQLFNRALSRRLAAGVGPNEPVEGDVVVGLDAEGRPERDNPHDVTKRNLARVKRQCERGRALVTGTIFGSESDAPHGMMGDIERAVVEEAGYTSETFRVPHLPEVASRGTRRELLAPIGPVDWRAKKDKHGEHVELSFFLLKGSYATCLMREILKTDAINYG